LTLGLTVVQVADKDPRDKLPFRDWMSRERPLTVIQG